ncbi:MBL fold metallo-hydrolase [Caulobacter sp. SLTY]|uniref:MBL fold metallo-hydrolase n=1 Tax=Caulobacter sp. SLTY TaxID=2683262 RepID=UPI00196A4F15|nr:MBL fold metallo-hydrolase [Caulobacter sp. SLTY]
MSRLEVTILGSGSSGGVPRADGNWGACDPAEPKNRRRRCSLLLRRLGEGPSTTVVIDTSPDFREQAISAQVQRLDAILFTHDHADQAHGIDDIRAFAINQRSRIPAWMDARTSEILTRRFNYIFQSTGGYPAICEARAIPGLGVRFEVEGPSGPIPAVAFDVEHGEIRSLGFRFGAVAYTPDVNGLPQSAFDALEGVDTWIVDALRYTPHPTHAHLEQTLTWAAEVKPRRTILTNLHIDMDFKRLQSELPAGVEAGFDELSFEVELDD